MGSLVENTSDSQILTERNGDVLEGKAKRGFSGELRAPGFPQESGSLENGDGEEGWTLTGRLH